jgi:hypothetical protein
MSHHGVVTAAVADAAKGTWYAHGSIPRQTADCTARAEREGWIDIATRRKEAKSAHDRSRDDGLVQARVHADRHAVRLARRCLRCSTPSGSGGVRCARP